MGEDAYSLEGTVRIPEDKKDEFNEYILRILDKCGIRKTEKMELGGQTVTVVRQPMPDEQGIVRFDYSIFEKKQRETAEYNLNTCELKVPDRGYKEFAIVMNMIMVMQEAYSEEQCYFMYKDGSSKINKYALLIKGVLGIHLRFPNREKLWEMLFFLKNTEKYHNIRLKMLLDWDAYSHDFWEFIPEQFVAADCVDDELYIPAEPFEGEKSEIKKARIGCLYYYVYQNVEKFLKNKEEENLKVFLRNLLDADLAKRQELAEDVRYGMIAEVSLYVLPSVIVQGYALAVHQPFWDAWKELVIRKGYSDIFAEERRTKDKEDDGDYIPFYKGVQRECEDEFIEFWKDDNLYFSDDMKKCLSDWRAQFMETDPEEDLNVETCLAQIVTELDQEWGCRLVDQKFVTEFMEHKEDANYKKALFFYSRLMNRDLYYFPELTKKQAIRWALRYNQPKFDFTEMGAFQSLLINHEYRYEILGF